ncbi:ABC transporter permease [Chromatiales bacterium (ex Bugula neritina AB1)]|nr:ABC transporter permease [Chromatiales bacterium (ex Bugula neritina AB1)]
MWALSTTGLVLVWAVVAWYAQSRALPSPLQVLEAVVSEYHSGDLIFHTTATLIRVAAAFLVAMVIGSAVGIALGRSQTLDYFFDPWVILFLNIPALVIIVLSYIWFGLSEAAAIGAVALNKIPNVVVTVREGAKSMDPSYMEMARVFKFSRFKTLIHVILPQLQPYLAAATRSGIALIWKIVLVVELLGRSNGVGFQIHLYFQLFDVATILAYTLTFVFVMLLVEFLLLQPLERHSRRWRASHA